MIDGAEHRNKLPEIPLNQHHSDFGQTDTQLCCLLSCFSKVGMQPFLPITAPAKKIKGTAW